MPSVFYLAYSNNDSSLRMYRREDMLQPCLIIDMVSVKGSLNVWFI